jgi:hypothetical protein
MSSTYSDSEELPAANCIDGDTNNLCHSQGAENAPWLAINFGQSVDVKSVTIYNRIGYEGRFRNAEVRVTDDLPADGSVMFTGGQLLGTFEGPGPQVIHIQGVTDLRGRYTWP